MKSASPRKKRPQDWSRERAYEQLLAHRVGRIRACVEVPSREEYYANVRDVRPGLTDEVMEAKYNRRTSREFVAEQLSRQLQPWENSGVHARIAKALRKYHFSSRETIQKHKALPKKLDNLASALRKLEESAQWFMENPDILNLRGMQEVVRVGAIRIVLGMRDRIEENKEKIISALPPIRRKDDTARERLLVLELARTFKRYSNSHKTAAIVHLMDLEGIQTPLGERTIERIICKSRHTTDGSRAALRA